MPLVPNATSPHVLVIGGGVSGITSAITLRQAGYRVSVVAEKYEQITSNVAGALWEWPPAVCGQHGEPRSLARSKDWCMVSYDKFKKLHAEHGETVCGVYLRDVYFYFRHPVDNTPFDLNKMNELKAKVDGFARGLDIVPKDVDPDFVKDSIKDCYKHMAPMVDTDKYMPWLQQQAREIGCKLMHEKIEEHVIRDEEILRQRYGADAIVACPGLGAIGLLEDGQMYPLRGALVRVKQSPGTVTAAHCISHEEGSFSEQDIVFIVPRGDNHVVLGGLAQKNRWGQEMSLNEPIISQMYQGCLDLLPALRGMELDPQENVRTGLRPFTEKNVLLDPVPGTKVVLNYGHGGAGVTLSWGCAQEVVQLVADVLRGPPSLRTISTKFASGRPTTFILQDMLPFRSQIERLDFMEHNFVLICSRRGLTKVPPQEFAKFNLVRVMDTYEFEHVASEVSEIMSGLGLAANNTFVATNDEYSVLLAGQVREAIGISGMGARSLLPFYDKDQTKKVLGVDGPVRVPRYELFDPKKFAATPSKYVKHIVDKVGSKLFIKPIVGAGSEKTWRLDGGDQLQQWCEENVTSDSIYEIDERITGELFDTSIVRIQGANRFFYAMRHSRPNDEYVLGHNLGVIIVPETDPVYQKLQEFSEAVLEQMKDYCSENGVYNVDFFLEEGTGEPVLMEVAARAAGGGVSQVVELSGGVALDETSLLTQMGHFEPLFCGGDGSMKSFAVCSMHPPKPGVVKSLELPSLDSTLSCVSWRVMVGQRLQAPTSMRNIALLLIISNDDLDALKCDFDRVNGEDYLQVSK